MKEWIWMLLLACGTEAWGQNVIWKGQAWQGTVGSDGCLQELVFQGNGRNDTVPFFRNSENAGPAFYAEIDGKEQKARWVPDGKLLTYKANIDGVECRMTYTQWKNLPALQITLENKAHVPFQPTKAGLKLGIDTYMDKYPDWFGKCFPTFLRNEKTHFYGYLQTPAGHTLGIVSAQPVASWSVAYNLGYQDPAPHWFMGHRIESLNIDLLNALPLPAHCPQDLWKLEQGESKTWTLSWVNIPSADEFERSMYQATGLPMLDMRQTTGVKGETLSFDVWSSDKATVTVRSDSGKLLPLREEKTGKKRRVSFTLPQTGLYSVCVKDADGKQVEGVVSAHATWQKVLEDARAGAWTYKQKATSHIESWYGFHSAFLAAAHFPDKQLDEKLKDRFEYLFRKLHDTQKMEPKYHASRIQNTSGTIGLLVDKYQAYGDINDVKRASRLADWLIGTWQRPDGAYVNHHTVYTSVIYVAKSILELVLVERRLGQTDAAWAEAAKRHYASAKRAIDQLVASQGDFETEGELTFEDGMISCSALQIGMLGLMQTDEAQREHYRQAMLQILNSHDCLAQLRVPDARRRGGTMRYWEAQYDVQMLPNMFNSPHGWSGWRAYATYYAYLLTGNERWLAESYNAMGAFSHLIDYKTGKLHWAFVVDPYLKVRQACSADTHVTADSLSFGNPHPDLYDTRTFIIGEQYVNMVSDWQTVNTQDNDVHEVFKFLGEAFLDNAFVVERADGTLKGYNCTVERKGNRLTVKARERQMVNLHCNLRHAFHVSFAGQSKALDAGFCGWAFGTDEYRQ